MISHFDRYAGLFFLAIGLFFSVESFSISSSAYGSNVGPNIFPLGLGILLILLSLRLIYEDWKKGSVERKESWKVRREDLQRFFLLLFLSFAYVLLLERLGYVISTFFFLFLSFQAMEKGKWVSSFLIALLFSSIVYYLFAVVLKGTLPGLPAWLGG
ncbi:tripartite tricarboxylate transporter TctB family protein [Thermicanus aegyptius]|uniref:tripartite tricarboxylate transporter TctB family protein n=1 Tax=Thermicanus aegyptius TaxID=94009 RepID=UPI00041C6884|nr:tripartite tricarboxylate transporter TctB family protein [Thermicanus aegyptius]